jgi:hypothetical protein
MHRRADCSKAQRELGYEPTSVRDALREAFDWFVANGGIPRATSRVATRGPHLEEV